MFNPRQGETKLYLLRYEAVQDLLQKPETVLIFLGVKRRNISSSLTDVNVEELPAWFAISTDEDTAELLKRCPEKNCCFPEKAFRDLLKLSEEDAGGGVRSASSLESDLKLALEQ